MDDRVFTKLIEFLEWVPAIHAAIGKGAEDDGRWWVKFDIDIGRDLAWSTLQQRSPTQFTPIYVTGSFCYKGGLI